MLTKSRNLLHAFSQTLKRKASKSLSLLTNSAWHQLYFLYAIGVYLLFMVSVPKNYLCTEWASYCLAVKGHIPGKHNAY